MNTIEQAKADKAKMTDKIKDAILEFEAVYGENSVQSLRIKRWNGSNEAFGKVGSIESDIRLL